MKLIRYRSQAPTFDQSTLLDELDRLFEAGFPSFTQGSASKAFPVDVYQDQDFVRIRAELPGFRKEDLQVTVADDILTVTGRVVTESKNESSPKTETSVERAIALPENLNYDKISATYENGVLVVTLPKREETKPRTVAVEVK